MKKFKIKTRYQYWSAYDGIQWTKWHSPMFVGDIIFDNEKDVKAKIKELKEKVKPFDKITKLKTEYTYEEIED